MTILQLIIVLTLSVPVAYAQSRQRCGIIDTQVTQGTDGYSHRIEQKQIVFQWKRVKDGFEMELKTNDSRSDWVGVGFCREAKMCMDNCAYAILWRPHVKKPEMADCFMPVITAISPPYVYSISNGPQCDASKSFLKVSNTSYSDAGGLEVKFMRELESNFSGPSFRLDGDMWLIWARGTMTDESNPKPNLGDTYKNGMTHFSQCGRSTKQIFKVEKYQANQNKGSSKLFLEASILLTCIGYLLISS